MQAEGSPGVSVQHTSHPLPSPFAEDAPSWDQLSPNHLTPTNSLIKSSQSGAPYTLQGSSTSQGCCGRLRAV